MALQKTITLDNRLEVKDAYLKIVNISGDKSAISFNIGAFIDKEHLNDQPLKIFYNSLSVNLDENVWVQIYDFFKITDDGFNSIDV